MKQSQFITQPSSVALDNIKPTGIRFSQYFQQHKKLFATVLLGVWLASSTVSLLSYQPSYVAKGMVMIKDTALTAKYVTGDSYETTTSQATSSVINTMGLLKTDVYMQNLWDFFSRTHPEELRKIRIKNITQWESYFGDGSRFIKYSNLPGTDIISLEFKWSNPEVAKQALDVVVETFKNLSLQLNQSEQHERSRYLAGQVDEIQNKLTTLRGEISRFKEENQVIDTAEENANLVRMRTNLKTDLATANAQARGKMQALSGYQQLLSMSPKQAIIASGVGRNEVLGKLYSELYGVRAERNSLLSRYTESSVKVQDLDNRINQLESNIKKELTRTIGYVPDKNELKDPTALADTTRSDAVGHMINAKTDAMALKTQSYVLQHYLSELNTRAKTLNQAEAVLANYKLQESILDGSLKTLKEKEIDAKLKESQTLSNIFVVQPSRIPLKASFPTQTHLLLLDLILGVGCAFAVIFTKFNLQNQSLALNNIIFQEKERTSRLLSDVHDNGLTEVL